MYFKLDKEMLNWLEQFVPGITKEGGRGHEHVFGTEADEEVGHQNVEPKWFPWVSSGHSSTSKGNLC